MLEQYGAAELEAAIAEALQQQVPHPNAVRLALQRRREQRGQLPPLAPRLPDDPRVRDIVVRSPHLADYDRLQAAPQQTPEERQQAPAPQPGGQDDEPSQGLQENADAPR